jgi:hypothetical protein
MAAAPLIDSSTCRALLANGSIYIADDYWASLLKSQVLQRLKYQTAKKKMKISIENDNNFFVFE